MCQKDKQRGGGDLGELQTLLRLLRGNLTYRQAAELSGVSHNYIRILERGCYPRTGKPALPSVEVLRRLAKAYEYSFDQLMLVAGYRCEHVCAICPIIAQANGGIQTNDFDKYTIREAQFNCELFQSRYIFVLVTDDSMQSARLMPGDLAVVELSNTIDDGKVGVVSLNGEKIIRRCYLRNDKWHLTAEHTESNSIVVPVQDVVVIGMVVASIAHIA